MTAQNAQRYGLPVDSGAYIAAVNSGSGAAEAGLQEGDIITKFDGNNVESASDLMLDVRSKNPGDKVTLEVNRNGETKQVEVTLGSDESAQGASTQQNSGRSLCSSACSAAAPAAPSRTLPSLRDTHHPSPSRGRIEQDAALRSRLPSARPCGIFRPCHLSLQRLPAFALPSLLRVLSPSSFPSLSGALARVSLFRPVR
ncbi:MAG: S1C family serine protease [Eggerthellaceae bacterium]